MPTRDTPVVLIVEDDPPVRELLNEVLEDEGYEVVAVHDGAMALQVIDSLRVDLITLDLDLPGLSGSELLEVLRKRKLKVPPVIVVTSTKPTRRRISQMAQVVIAKPFDVDELLTAVLELLPRSMPGAEAKVKALAAQSAAAREAEEEDAPAARERGDESTDDEADDATAKGSSSKRGERDGSATQRERALQAGRQRRRPKTGDDPEVKR